MQALNITLLCLLVFIDRKRPMFSLVVSVSYDKGKAQYDVNTVKDVARTVRNKIQECDVYVGERVVAATVLRWPDVLEQCPKGPVQWRSFLSKCRSTPQTWAEVNKNCPPNTFRDGMADHAEYRTLQNIGNLVSKHGGSEDLLVFYVLASPCDKRCTNKNNKWNILESIEKIKKWKNYAVVFTNVFQPRNGEKIPVKERREALKRLGSSIGLGNIFRCYNKKMQCINCSSTDPNQVVDRRCYI